jgi:hypothetical protein
MRTTLDPIQEGRQPANYPADTGQSQAATALHDNDPEPAGLAQEQEQET